MKMFLMMIISFLLCSSVYADKTVPHEQTDAAVAQLSAYFADTIPRLGDFAIEQAPDVYQQIVRLGIYTGLMDAFGAFLICVCSGVFAVFSWKRSVVTKWDSPWVIGVIAGSFIFVIASVGVFSSLSYCVAPYFTPKAFLLEKIGVLK